MPNNSSVFMISLVKTCMVAGVRILKAVPEEKKLLVEEFK